MWLALHVARLRSQLCRDQVRSSRAATSLVGCVQCRDPHSRSALGLPSPGLLQPSTDGAVLDAQRRVDVTFVVSMLLLTVSAMQSTETSPGLVSRTSLAAALPLEASSSKWRFELESAFKTTVIRLALGSSAIPLGLWQLA